MKLVPDQSQRAAEKEILIGLGFIVIGDDACAVLSRTSHRFGSSPRTLKRKMNEFGRLLEKEIPRLRRYAVAMTRDMSRADDLVQDTLVRAIAKQSFWQSGTKLRAWLFTIMHNQNVNWVRRRVREGTAVGFDDEGPFPIAATDPTGGLSLRDLDRALTRIPEQQRQVDTPDRSRRDFVSGGRDDTRRADRHHPLAPVTWSPVAPHADGLERRNRRGDQRGLPWGA
jgi:hypothetical protein